MRELLDKDLQALGWRWAMVADAVASEPFHTAIAQLARVLHALSIAYGERDETTLARLDDVARPYVRERSSPQLDPLAPRTEAALFLMNWCAARVQQFEHDVEAEAHRKSPPGSLAQRERRIASENARMFAQLFDRHVGLLAEIRRELPADWHSKARARRLEMVWIARTDYDRAGLPTFSGDELRLLSDLSSFPHVPPRSEELQRRFEQRVAFYDARGREMARQCLTALGYPKRLAKSLYDVVRKR